MNFFKTTILGRHIAESVYQIIGNEMDFTNNHFEEKYTYYHGYSNGMFSFHEKLPTMDLDVCHLDDRELYLSLKIDDEILKTAGMKDLSINLSLYFDPDNKNVFSMQIQSYEFDDDSTMMFPSENNYLVKPENEKIIINDILVQMFPESFNSIGIYSE